MPAALIYRINLDLLYPPFLSLLLETLAACRARGADYYAICGFRSQSEQAANYAKGRTAPGPKVTNAPPGFSTHEYGCAVDTCHDKDLGKLGLQPDWDAAAYVVLKEEGAKRGLQVGVPSIAGGDVGHVQLPLAAKLQRPEKDVLTELKALLGSNNELTGVWARLDELGPWD